MSHRFISCFCKLNTYSNPIKYSLPHSAKMTGRNKVAFVKVFKLNVSLLLQSLFGSIQTFIRRIHEKFLQEEVLNRINQQRQTLLELKTRSVDRRAAEEKETEKETAKSQEKVTCK